MVEYVAVLYITRAVGWIEREVVVSCLSRTRSQSCGGPANGKTRDFPGEHLVCPFPPPPVRIGAAPRARATCTCPLPQPFGVIEIAVSSEAAPRIQKVV